MWAHLKKTSDKDKLRSLAKRKCSETGYIYDPLKIFEDATLRRIDSAWKTQLHHLIPSYIARALRISSLSGLCSTRPERN